MYNPYRIKNLRDIAALIAESYPLTHAYHHPTKTHMSEIEETLFRIEKRLGNGGGILIVNNEGIPINSTIQDDESQTWYSHLITSLATKARHCVRDLDPTNDLTFLRLRTTKSEIMVAPEKDFVLIVIQMLQQQ